MIEVISLIAIFLGGFALGQAFLIVRTTSRLGILRQKVIDDLNKAEAVHDDLVRELDSILAILDQVDPMAANRLRMRIRINRANLKVIANDDTSPNT